MNDDIMAGSRAANVLADEWDAESLLLLTRHIGSSAAKLALSDEAYLSLVLPVLYSDGSNEDALARLKAAFAPRSEMSHFRDFHILSTTRPASGSAIVQSNSTGQKITATGLRAGRAVFPGRVKQTA